MILFVFITSSFAVSKVFIQESSDKITYNFTIDDFKFRKVQFLNKNFNTISLIGVEGYEGVRFKEGHPELPVIRKYLFSKPTVVVGKKNLRQLSANSLMLKPSQPSRVKLPSKDTSLVINKAAYESKDFQPKVPYSIESAGSVRGRERYLLTLYPVTYSPLNKSYELISSFKVVVPKTLEPQNKSDGYIFLVAQQFSKSPAVKRYQAFKESLGFDVTVVIIDEGQEPESIRQKVKEIYALGGLKYGLIFGDAELITPKRSSIINGVTDHYYRAIDSDDYLTDINGPDIGLGRISVKTEEDLNNVVDKYIKYEKGYFNREQWLNGISFLATDDRYTIAEASHNYVIDTYTKSLGYVGDFPNKEELGGDRLYAVTHEVSNDKVQEILGLGRTIINYSGHGATTFWDAPRMSQEDIKALNHEDATAFVVSNACITGQFTVDESFAETWQRHPYGAVMYWGSVDNTYWDEDDILERKMYDGIFANDKTTFAQITQYALSNHWLHYGGEGKSKYYWETYTVFGDPSHSLRTSHSKNVSLAGDNFISLGSNNIAYSLFDDEGGPIKNAKVVLHHPESGSKFLSYSNELGNVDINLGNQVVEPTKFNLSITGKNLKRYEDVVEVIPSKTPFLGFSNYYFSDRGEAYVYSFESVNLNFLLTNWGDEDAGEGYVSIKEVVGPAHIVEGRTRIPAIKAKESYFYQGDELLVKVDEQAHAGDTIKIIFEWTLDSGIVGETTASLLVKKANIEILDIDFGNTLEIGGIASGSNGDIFVTIKNTGNESIYNGELYLHAGECLAQISGSWPVPSLKPGEILRLENPYTAYVDNVCTNGQQAVLTAYLSYASIAQRFTLNAKGSFNVGYVSLLSSDFTDIALEIPDNSPTPIEFSFSWDEPGTIIDVGLSLNIIHSYIGDLEVKLYHPDGTQAIIHRHEGAGASNINETYGYGGNSLSSLAVFKDKKAQGIWRLLISDTSAVDVGTLEGVGLTLLGYFER